MALELFFKATKDDYRFQTPKGSLNVIQLHKLDMGDLDETYKTLEATIDKTKGLSKKGNNNSIIKSKMKVVAEIYSYKESLEEQQIQRTLNKKREQDLLAEKERRDSVGLQKLSDKELERELNKLS